MTATDSQVQIYQLEDSPRVERLTRIQALVRNSARQTSNYRGRWRPAPKLRAEADRQLQAKADRLEEIKAAGRINALLIAHLHKSKAQRAIEAKSRKAETLDKLHEQSKQKRAYLRTLQAPKTGRWFGFPPVQLIRWMGQQKWAPAEAIKACKAMGLTVADNTVKIQLKAGAAGQGTVAQLTTEQQDKLRKMR
jgi:hypothetical protein